MDGEDILNISENSAKLDFLAVGETVIDLISTEMVDFLVRAKSFQRNLGGSPANIATNLAQLGFKTGLITSVGEDAFGDLARETFLAKGLDLAGIQRCKDHRTSIIIVGRTHGTPEVIHYRDADKHLVFDDTARQLIDQAKIVHFSGFALSQLPARTAIQEMKKYALQRGKVVTFDPCFHAPLWDDPEEGRLIFEEFLTDVTYVKPSKDDLVRLWGEISPEEGIKRYQALGAKHVLLTMGEEGVLFTTEDGLGGLVPDKVAVQDATGAGDSFWSGFVGGLLVEKSFSECVQLGMRTAAITLQHVGAIAPLPHIGELC